MGFLPVTCYLTCPVTDYATKTSGTTRFASQLYMDFPSMAESMKAGRLEATFEVVGPVGLEPTTNGFRFAAISGLSGLCLQRSVAALAVRRQVSTPSQPTG